MNIKIDTPIFIVGVGRSGTTLIQSMLNAHKDIVFTPEIHFFKNFITNIKVNKKLETGNINWLKKKIINDKNLQRLEFDLKNIIDDLLNKKKFNLVNFYKSVLKQYALKKEKSMIGDKDPKNIEYLHNIKKVFPKAYIIHIIRDPRDVMLSRMKAEWSKKRKFLTHVFTYREQLNKGRKDGKKLFENRYYELFYEDLIETPEKKLKNICEFLGLEYDSNMMYFNKKASEIIKGEEKKWKENCFKPVISSNKNKWKEQLSKEQVVLVENICQVPFQDLNYIKSDYEDIIGIYYKFYYSLLKIGVNCLDVFYNLYHKWKSYRVNKYISETKVYGG